MLRFVVIQKKVGRGKSKVKILTGNRQGKGSDLNIQQVEFLNIALWKRKKGRGASINS